MATRPSPTAPLRNRLCLDLAAPPESVWAVVGELSKFPEYSAGLEKVTVGTDHDGEATEYVCYFRPIEDGSEGVVHRELFEWLEPSKGFASRAEEPNAFGLSEALTLVTLEPVDGSTRLTWEQYYDAEDLDVMQAAFDQALEDIGQNLVQRFGGRLVDRSVAP